MAFESRLSSLQGLPRYKLPVKMAIMNDDRQWLAPHPPFPKATDGLDMAKALLRGSLY